MGKQPQITQRAVRVAAGTERPEDELWGIPEWKRSCELGCKQRTRSPRPQDLRPHSLFNLERKTVSIETDSAGFLGEVLVWFGSRLLGHSSITHCTRGKDIQSQFVKGPNVEVVVSLSTTFTQRLTPLVSKRATHRWRLTNAALFGLGPISVQPEETSADIPGGVGQRRPVKAEAMNNQGLQHLTPMFTQSVLGPQCEKAKCNQGSGVRD